MLAPPILQRNGTVAFMRLRAQASMKSMTAQREASQQISGDRGDTTAALKTLVRSCHLHDACLRAS